MSSVMQKFLRAIFLAYLSWDILYKILMLVYIHLVTIGLENVFVLEFFIRESLLLKQYFVKHDISTGEGN